MSTSKEAKVRDQGPIITEADIEALDTTSVVDVPLEATDRINAVFLKLGSAIAVVTTLIMVGLMTIAVVMRYGFNSSLPIAAEGPTYLLPWLIAAGAIVAQAQMAHVGIDYFLEKFKGRVFHGVSVAIWIFVSALMVYFTYLAIYMVGPMAAQETPILGWPMLGSFGAMIVMSICMAIQAGARAYFFFKYGAPRSTDTTATGTVPREDVAREIKGV